MVLLAERADVLSRRMVPVGQIDIDAMDQDDYRSIFMATAWLAGVKAQGWGRSVLDQVRYAGAALRNERLDAIRRRSTHARIRKKFASCMSDWEIRGWVTPGSVVEEEPRFAARKLLVDLHSAYGLETLERIVDSDPNDRRWRCEKRAEIRAQSGHFRRSRNK